MSVLGVKSGVVDEVDSASNDITGGKSRPIWLACTRRTKTVSVVTVVSVRVFVPTRKSVDVNSVRRETDSHVTVSPFAHDLHLEVIQATSCRYRMRRADTGSVFVCLPITCKNYKSLFLFVVP